MKSDLIYVVKAKIRHSMDENGFQTPGFELKTDKYFSFN